MDLFVQIVELLLFEENSHAKSGGDMANYGMVPQRKEI